jgi:hypothetical protein
MYYGWLREKWFVSLVKPRVQRLVEALNLKYELCLCCLSQTLKLSSISINYLPISVQFIVGSYHTKTSVVLFSLKKKKKKIKKKRRRKEKKKL